MPVMPRPGATLEAILDMMMEGILIALLVFTPLAFGAVHTWALSLAQAAIAVLFGLWLCRLIWSRSPTRPGRNLPGAGTSFSLLGYRFLRTRLGAPIALFLALVLLQLLPLPPALVRLVSPAAGQAYSRSLPGYAEAEMVNFARLEPWLLHGDDAGVVERLIRTPADLPVKQALSFSSSRPLSLYPFATMGRLVALMALLMAFLVVTNRIHSRVQQNRLFWVVTLSGFFMSVLAVVQRLQWNGKIYWFYPASEDASPFGPFFNHNHFAAYLEMAFPLGLGLVLASLRRGPDALARLVLSGFSSVVMLAALVMSGSRGAVLSLSAAVLCYGLVLVARGQVGRPEWIVGLSVLAAALAFAGWIGVEHLTEMGRKLQNVAEFESEPSLSARLIGWSHTLEILADYPILGAGLGAFAEAWIHDYPSGTANIWKEAHNDYLQVAAETGLVGTLIFLWGLWLFLRLYLFRDVRPAPGAWEGDIYIHHGIAIGILSILFHSWVDFSLQVGAISFLFVVLSAIMIGDSLRSDSLVPREA